MRSWYALHVETGREAETAAALRRFGCPAVVPMELRHERREGRTRERLHVYVPGYVFVKLELSPDKYYRICAAPHVFRFLGGGTPDRIPDGQMGMMLALAAHGATMRPAPARQTDGRTIITGGPLQKLQPEILRVNARDGHATIEVRVLDKVCRTTVQIQLEQRGA